MSAIENNKKILSTWKEISVYLDCDVRTCIRWENKYGLPVYRIDASTKSRVYAYEDELENWRKERANNNLKKRKFFSQNFSVFKILALIIPVIILIFIVIFIGSTLQDSEPYDFRIEKSNLVILNKAGKELWHNDTGLENLIENDQYHRHFQTKKTPEFEEDGGATLLPWLKITDINNDGHKEILFAPCTQDQYGVEYFYCYDSRGNELWRYPLGNTITYDKVFQDFCTRGFDTEDLDNDGYPEIILITNAATRFPTRICILNHLGKSQGEYWNSGHLADFVAHDLNGDGIKELIVVGQNTEYKKGCVIVFDPFNMEGGSPQKEPYFSSRELKTGTEKFYLLLPRTEADLLKSVTESAAVIHLLGNDLFKIRLDQSSIYFYINHQFEPTNVVLGHRFEKLYLEYFREGKVDEIEDKQAYIQNLLNNALYWNGKGWVNKASMSNSW